jgi:hypothetical protein
MGLRRRPSPFRVNADADADVRSPGSASGTPVR